MADKKYMLISCGCAECRGFYDDCLIEVVGIFDTIEEAKDASWIKQHLWKDHPQGGVYANSGQGDDWILPVPDNMPDIKKEG